jgi:hypothetical protein
MQTQNRHSIADSFPGLAAAVISRALADLERDRAVISGHVRDEAMAWINGQECEAFCYAINVDYPRTIRERVAALYRCFLERAESNEAGKTRKIGMETVWGVFRRL